MVATPLVIFGASGHGRVIADAARASGQFEVIGFLDIAAPAGRIVDGIEVLGGDDRLPELAARHAGLAGIAGVGDNRVRAGLVMAIGAAVPDFRFATVVHPRATLAAGVAPGQGAFVAAGAVINCGVRLGAHTVVNTGAVVDHDCMVEEYAFIAPGAVLAGSVSVGRGAFVGTGAAIIPGVEIGAGATVGAGAVVVRPVAAGLTVVGVPAAARSTRPV